MRTGLLVTTNRNVYKTSDGENFVKVYNSGSTKIDIQRAPFKLDYQNIWTIGYDQAIETGLIFIVTVITKIGIVTYLPLILKVW